MEQKYVSAVRAGLSWGVVLAVCELAFGAVLYFLRQPMLDYVQRVELASLLPLAAVWLAFLFLVLAIYFACGMIAAKWLAPLPLRSKDIAVLGALAGAIAEIVRSAVAVLVNFALSVISPLVSQPEALSTALINASIRLACGLPLFVVIAAVVAGVSAYLFSMIFFRPEGAPK